MGVTLEVTDLVLSQAQLQWDDAGDDLDGGWRRLDKASTQGFSAEVTAAVEAFVEPWVEEIKLLADRAVEYALDIAVFRSGAIATDVAQAELIRSLLPWSEHDAAIGTTP